MNELKIHTNEDAFKNGVVVVDGTKVTVGGAELLNIGSLCLEGDPGGVWELVIRVAVDPATLFVTRGHPK